MACTVLKSAQWHTDNRGSLRVYENFPFPVVRMFTIAGVPEKEVRGEHAHKDQSQVIICAKGSFTLAVHDGEIGLAYLLLEGNQMLVPPMHWITLSNFTRGSVALVLCSGEYKPPISDWNEFINARSVS